MASAVKLLVIEPIGNSVSRVTAPSLPFTETSKSFCRDLTILSQRVGDAGAALSGSSASMKESTCELPALTDRVDPTNAKAANTQFILMGSKRSKH